MQGVFLLSALAMFVPVIFHTATVKESDSLNRDAPGKSSILSGAKIHAHSISTMLAA